MDGGALPRVGDAPFFAAAVDRNPYPANLAARLARFADSAEATVRTARLAWEHYGFSH